MSKKLEKRIPLFLALFYVVLSVVVIWGTLFLSMWYKKYTLEEKKDDPRYTVRGIIAHSQSADTLQKETLAELANLSNESVYNLYEFDVHALEKRLQELPCIASAYCQRIRPNAIYISYELKKPYVRLADFENIALDKKGYPFFLSPYYTSKELPQVLIGLDDFSWHEPVATPELENAYKVLEILEQKLSDGMKVFRVDTHNVQAKSKGAKEVVVVLAEDHSKFYLRLNYGDFENKLQLCLSAFRQIQKSLNLEKNEHIIDCRFDGFFLVTSQ